MFAIIFVRDSKHLLLVRCPPEIFTKQPWQPPDLNLCTFSFVPLNYGHVTFTRWKNEDPRTCSVDHNAKITCEYSTYIQHMLHCMQSISYISSYITKLYHCNILVKMYNFFFSAPCVVSTSPICHPKVQAPSLHLRHLHALNCSFLPSAINGMHV